MGRIREQSRMKERKEGKWEYRRTVVEEQIADLQYDMIRFDKLTHACCGVTHVILNHIKLNE